jgi:hypothetical protein
VRNPYTKLVSAFHFLKSENLLDLESLNRGNKIRRWFKINRPPTIPEQFRAWVAHGKLFRDRQAYTIDGMFCMDFVIRQEELAAGIEHVCHVLDIPFRPNEIPRLKVASEPMLPLQEYYDSKTVQLVQERYRFELEHFNYPLTPW